MVRKFRDYQQLMKLNLSLLVVFSSLTGYIIVPDLKVELVNVVWLLLGGLLVTAAANAGNEIWERHTDLLMRRTMNRPLPGSRMRMSEAVFFCIVSLIAGLFILGWKFNGLSALLSAISFLLYVGAYTPLKRVSPISVLVGAIPGALPCLIGWVAATNHMASLSAWVLFFIQFFWQFPHFWAIAWVAHDDYERAGMKMLPKSEKVGYFTAFQCVLYSTVLVPMSALPMVTGLGGYISLIGLGIASLWYLWNALKFLQNNSDQMAKKVMFASFVYLPLALMVLILDKYI